MRLFMSILSTCINNINNTVNLKLYFFFQHSYCSGASREFNEHNGFQEVVMMIPGT